MKNNDNIFENILKLLQEEGILKELIIIGGWCLIIYRYLYNNPKEISSLRTSDIDFLIPLGQKFSKEVDIGEVFSKLDFEPVFSTSKGFIKYAHPEMEIEFLVPEVGRVIDKPYKLMALKSNVQRLRYLDILTKNSLVIPYKNYKVRVPEPAAYVINKIISSIRRVDQFKRDKDRKTAKELGEFILNDDKQKALLIKIFKNLNSKIQKRMLRGLEDISHLIYKVLSE
jgi:hypothetical protein